MAFSIQSAFALSSISIELIQGKMMVLPGATTLSTLACFSCITALPSFVPVEPFIVTVLTFTFLFCSGVVTCICPFSTHFRKLSTSTGRHCFSHLIMCPPIRTKKICWTLHRP